MVGVEEQTLTGAELFSSNVHRPLGVAALTKSQDPSSFL